MSPAAQWRVDETLDGDLGGGVGERTCGWVALKETLEIVNSVGHVWGLNCGSMARVQGLRLNAYS